MLRFCKASSRRRFRHRAEALAGELGEKAEVPVHTSSVHWQPFFGLGVVPALDKLEYVARAITPPNRVRRYDARFFLVDARHVTGELKGNGELEDLR